MISLIFDTETTGLLLPRTADLDKQPHIIDIALLKIEDGVIIGEFEQLLDPECEVSSIITKITGLTNADLVGKPKFRQILPELEEVFAGCDQLIAHNSEFDRGMLEVELERCARTGFPWPPSIICTVQEHMHLKGRRLKLTELYQMTMDRELKQEHRAMADVRALLDICLKRGIV